MGNGYYEKVDRLMAGWKPDPCSDGDLLRRADARITPLCLDVKGKMNGFAALDIHPHRRYVADMGGRRICRCRPHTDFALLLHPMDFTQNLGLTLYLASLPINFVFKVQFWIGYIPMIWRTKYMILGLLCSYIHWAT